MLSVISTIHVHPGPQKVTLFGNRVFADIISFKSLKVRQYWFSVVPNSNDWCRHKKKKRTHRVGVGGGACETEEGKLVCRGIHGFDPIGAIKTSHSNFPKMLFHEHFT